MGTRVLMCVNVCVCTRARVCIRARASARVPAPSQGAQKAHNTHHTEKQNKPIYRKYIRVDTREKAQYPKYRKHVGTLSTAIVHEKWENDHQTQREKKADT